MIKIMSAFSVKKVEIQNFRGIPGRLELDLSAPLTVITAANGSGKSSVCQAIEWLLTGESENVSGDSLRCKWGKGETYVRATCLLGDELTEIVRTPDILFKTGPRKDKRLSDSDLLKLLTPNETGVGSRADTRQRVKSDWLRGSRWLYSNAMSLLVDNDFAEQRRQIFANILGYGHLLPMQNSLRIYESNLPTDRKLKNEHEELTKKIDLLEKSVAADDGIQSLIVKNLADISALTGFELPETALPEKQCEAASVFLEQRQGALSSREKHLLSVKAGWQTLAGHKEQEAINTAVAQKAHQQLELYSATEKQLRQSLATVADELEKLQQTVRETENNLSKLSDWEKLAKQVSEITGVPKDVIDIPLLHFTLPESALDLETCSAQYAAWQKLSTSYDIWAKTSETIAILEEIVKKAPDENSLLQLHQTVQGARRESLQLSEAFKTVSTSLEQLQASGMELVKANHADDCPLCGQNYYLHDKLVEQLLKVSGKTDIAVQQARNVLLQAQERETQAISLYNDAKKRQQDALQARNDILRLQRETENIVADSGIRKWRENVGFRELGVELFPSLARTQLSVEIIRFITLLQAIAQTEAIPLKGVLSEQIQQAKNLLSARLTKNGESVNNRTSKRDAFAEQQKNNDEKIARLQKEIAEDEKASAQRLAVTTTLINSWYFLAQDNSVDAEILNRINEEIITESYVLESAKEYLGKARAALKVSTDIALLNVLRQKLQQVEQKILNRQKCVDTAVRTREHWDNHIRDVATKSLNRLLLPASELFSRMHANEVYQALSMGQKEGAFCWEAVMSTAPTGQPPLSDASEQIATLNAQTHFSQGQRQDLALSLFLARARTLGGSFFLDEPVAHLDDLNRVAMMDIFRMLTASEPGMNLVLTTASNGLRRHLRQKFSSESCKDNLRIITLEGNPLRGVTASYS
ncbi:TPA: AAA family ATPase [Raoultella ornithinolytica]